jgi:hypothetical protein
VNFPRLAAGSSPDHFPEQIVFIGGGNSALDDTADAIAGTF